jgi:GTP cyclohydrolase I
MKNNKLLYRDFEEISLEELEEDYTGFPEKISSDGNKVTMNDDEKIKMIADHFKGIMETLGLDLNDDSLKDTPQRVAKRNIEEIFSGLNPVNEPEVKLFENKYQYNKMLIEKDITLYSYCEHHFVHIIGRVHVAYISKGKIIGLLKINRLVQYYARRPQI